MKKEKRKYSAEFKARVALEAIKGRESVTELSQRFGLHASLVHAWKRLVLGAAPTVLENGGKMSHDAEEVRRLKDREIARLTTENEWLQKVLQRMSPSERRAAVVNGGGPLPLIRQVELLHINRSAVYYQRKHAMGAVEEERELAVN